MIIVYLPPRLQRVQVPDKPEQASTAEQDKPPSG